MNRIEISTFLFAFFFISACSSSPKKFTEETSTVTQNKTIKLKIDWVKWKGKKIDFKIDLENLTDQFIVVPKSDFRCESGASKGTAKAIVGFMSMDAEAYKDQGADNVQINPDQTKEMTMTCVLPKGSTKNIFTLRIKNIYKVVGGASSTIPLQLLEKDVLWKTKLQ